MLHIAIINMHYIQSYLRTAFLEDGGGGGGIWLVLHQLLLLLIHVSSERSGEPNQLGDGEGGRKGEGGRERERRRDEEREGGWER